MDNEKQQLRFNAGKPRLSYLFAHARALKELQYPGAYSPEAHELYQEAQNAIVQYLSGGPRSYLALAAGTTRLALEVELGGSPLERAPGYGQVMCDRADAAFCGVRVYGESKYERGNFRKGAPVTQYLDCALRHLRKLFRAHADADYAPIVALDSESKQAHGAHVYWNLLEALEQPDWRDDRLPPVNGGAYDADESFYNSPTPAVEFLESLPVLADEEPLVEVELITVQTAEETWMLMQYAESYTPGCDCSLCTELEPYMVEVEVTVNDYDLDNGCPGCSGCSYTGSRGGKYDYVV